MGVRGQRWHIGVRVRKVGTGERCRPGREGCSPNSSFARCTPSTAPPNLPYFASTPAHFPTLDDFLSLVSSPESGAGGYAAPGPDRFSGVPYFTTTQAFPPQSRSLIYSPRLCRLGEDCMAVGAVWTKLVSGCISLQTVKFTGKSAVFWRPSLDSPCAANPQIV